jgi:agmatinase
MYKVYGIPFCCNLKNDKRVCDIRIDCEKIVVDNEDKDKGLKQIEEKAKKIEKGIFVGGDHSITYAIVKAIKPNFLVIFDAHADLTKPLKTITNEDWLRALVEKKVIDEKDILLIGIRSYDKKEKEFIKEKGIPVVFFDKFYLSLNEIVEFVMEKMKEKDKVYLSIDIDVINGSEIETNFPEPFGLSSREFLYIIEKISKLREKIFAIDITEAITSHELTKKIVEKTIKVFNA